MKNSLRTLALAASMVASSTSAYAQFGFMNALPAVSNIVGDVAGNLTGRALSNKGEDLQKSRDEFFADEAAQLEGLDAETKAKLLDLKVMMWDRAENDILKANAKLVGEREGPIINMANVANAAVGVLASTVAMNSAVSMASPGMNSMNSGVLAGLQQGVIGSAQAAVSGVVNDALADTSKMNPEDLRYKPSEKVHPLKFFGEAHPSTLKTSDLYRENGFIGWKRVDTSDSAVAYSPIMGQGEAKFAVFLHDSTGAVIGTFRVLTVSPAAFSSVVRHFSEEMGAPKYASESTMMRALWPNGAYVTADANQLSVGWSASPVEVANTSSAKAGSSDQDSKAAAL